MKREMKENIIILIVCFIILILAFYPLLSFISSDEQVYEYILEEEEEYYTRTWKFDKKGYNSILIIETDTNDKLIRDRMECIGIITTYEDDEISIINYTFISGRYLYEVLYYNIQEEYNIIRTHL